jgi:hypothetical protein
MLIQRLLKEKVYCHKCNKKLITLILQIGIILPLTNINLCGIYISILLILLSIIIPIIIL